MTQADMIQALVVMFNPDFDPTDWQTYLVSPTIFEYTMPEILHNARLTFVQIYLACIIVSVYHSTTCPP